MAHSCLRVPLRTKRPLCLVSKLLIDKAKEVLELLLHLPGIEVTADLWVSHFGTHGCSFDARGLAKDILGSWEVSVAGKCACGPWPAMILTALRDGVLLSIKPLELITCAFTLIVARKEGVVAHGVHIVWRNDNESAVADLNADRAT